MSKSAKNFIKQLWERFKNSVVFKILHFIVNSAAIALLITAILFVYQEHEEQVRTERIIANLQDISSDMISVQQNLSTRYLGIFPGYISEVNDLLKKCSPKDSIVIFEDVLYYGFLSRPKEFVQMNQLLISHADAGGAVTIAYYGEDGRTFHRVIREELISKGLYSLMEKERRASFKPSVVDIRRQDTILCRKYYEMSRENDPDSFEEKMARQTRVPLAPLCEEVECSGEIADLCAKIDSTRLYWLGGKPASKIDFFDFENMKRYITKEIVACYESHGIELCPLDEYLTMSCWLAGDNAVLAFPSKWSTDEIGFFSQDPAFSKYIKTMLDGVRGAL